MKTKTKKNNFIKAFIYCISALIWIGIWQITAMIIDKEIFLPTPSKVLTVLIQDLLPSEGFWNSVLASVTHICLGFFIGCALGIILAIIASLNSFLESFLWVPVRVLKSIPVASFVILVLLWLDAADLAVFVPAIVVLPMLYINTLTGIKETNGKLIQMAQVFRVSFAKRISHIYAPTVVPYILSACSLATGMAWKSGVAAEIIGLAKDSIGNELYQTKIYLMIPELFAWTIVIIILSVIFETVVKLLVKLVNRGE